MIGVVVSRADAASVHIGEHLLDLADWTTREDDSRPDGEGGGTVHRLPGVELRAFDALHLELEGVADAFSTPDIVVFASKHAGETGPLLTAHHTGNFGVAEAGGRDADLAETAPNAHARVLEALAEHAPGGYDVGMEGTHHGPSQVGAPSLFVELGSAEDEWNDPDGARAVARAILDLQDADDRRETDDPRGTDDLRNADAHRDRQLVGLGGGHYAPRFERVVRETDWAVGHVAPDWQLDALAEHAAASESPDTTWRGVLQQALVGSRATHVLIEGEHPEAERVLAGLDCRVVSETWVRETTGVPLSLVGWAEDAIAPIDAGLRFGEPARDDDDHGDQPPGDRATGDPGTIVDLPGDLLAEVRGIDPDATRRAVAARALAFDTDQGGTQVAGRVALPEVDDRAAILDALVGILGQRYGTVERREDAIVAREAVFDPERARTLGVSEGPEFGRLADGESVTVDGESIPPEVVHEERERRFPV